MRRQYTILFIIIILFGLVIWMNLPSNPGIAIGTFYRSMQPVLGLDLRGGVQVLLEADTNDTTLVNAQSMEDARQILENRTNALGVSENQFQIAGTNRIVGEFPGLSDPERIIAVIKETGLLEFVDLGDQRLNDGTVVTTTFGGDTTQPTATPEAAAGPTPTTQAGEAAAPTPTATTPEQIYNTIMTGVELKDVGVTTNTTGGYEIAFTLSNKGAQLFRDYTTNNVGKYLAIVLDKKIISAPVIENPIPDGQGRITGSFTNQQANDLAIQMRYGSLPIPFKVVESRIIGPTLGQDSLNKSLIAGIIGFTIVILFMAIYYRIPGLMADLSIILYALIVLSLFRLIPVTLDSSRHRGFPTQYRQCIGCQHSGIREVQRRAARRANLHAGA